MMNAPWKKISELAALLMLVAPFSATSAEEIAQGKQETVYLYCSANAENMIIYTSPIHSQSFTVGDLQSMEAWKNQVLARWIEFLRHSETVFKNSGNDNMLVPECSDPGISEQAIREEIQRLKTIRGVRFVKLDF